MRGLTSFAVLVVIFAGLGGYIYFFQSGRAPESAEVRQKAAEIPKDQIEQLVITSASGDVTTVTKTDGAWQITAPLSTPADDALITRLVTPLSGLDIIRVIDEHPTDLSQYGLAPPHVEVTIKTSAAAGTVHLLLGGKTPVGTAVYAQLSSDPRVILIAGDIEDAANKSPSDFRDKAVFRTDRDAIDTLEIEGAGSAVQLAKQGLEWELMKPLRTHGDLGVVSEVLTTLKSLQMASIVDAPSADSPKYRFDKPAFTVSVAAGTSRETLQVGGKADASDSYARIVSRPAVFTIPTAIVDTLKNEPAHYRKKDVFEFQNIDATRLEVLRDGQTTIYEKATEPGSDGKWREVSPQTRDIDQVKMDTALSKLSYLRALTFVPTPAGLTRGAAALSVLVKYDEGKKSESVRLATLGSDPYAARADWPDAAKLDASAYGQLVASLDDLQK
jgi:Domain of unknown function (DUF4340)